MANVCNDKQVLKKKLTPYGYLLPTIILLFILLVIPVIMVIGYSFFDNVIVNKNPVFVGLKNYATVLHDKNFWNAISNTLFFVIVSMVAHLVIGMVFALVLNTRYLGNKTKGIFRVIYALPWMFTASVIAILWRMMLDPSGVLNYLMMTLHITSDKVSFLATRSIALQAVTLINIWSGYPFYMISILAGLQGISTDLYEASSLDGANTIQTYLRITLPQLKPILISLLMLDFVWTLQQFALIWMTTGGGPVNATETVSTYIYKQAFTKYQYSTASTGAVLLLIVCSIVGVLYVRQQRSED
ncbi:Inner membrane ABC transporter permease protein ycjO [uncultured Clostridium sp.]|uniref:Sugar ABC transporter permease n=1 Tax=Muricoprocola aceti TaxID=2981772 RepID=A0ABT2SN17_9FIRM|nr:sugar ABC transporter permease [Muricoprocola aceti]MCI7226712.1 sugar ABC transporter permease [Lachnospiraceae bacterium]MCQ4775181.1 sugar ABC transporter permease [Lacrimispora saccharolytica]SCH51709.1 Inner membrane ABC transporter permease protein ycjO [uncultured Clostridium sp.]MCU6725448.1 sugar ABC transporter permease [Muricoprocola aceti]MDD7436456.1 sugar ABC transporter permease [Lachnospiraceae bacterium]